MKSRAYWKYQEAKPGALLLKYFIMTNFLEVFFICKKKFSGVLLLLLLLVSCFVTASAGTAEAWGL
ncbi:MAG: hypothetical protein IJQ63_07025 [Synergistaceae bacterium]|nr:hypothetical protein [Synergistaceae bacterium]